MAVKFSLNMRPEVLDAWRDVSQQPDRIDRMGVFVIASAAGRSFVVGSRHTDGELADDTDYRILRALEDGERTGYVPDLVGVAGYRLKLGEVGVLLMFGNDLSPAEVSQEVKQALVGASPDLRSGAA